MRSRLSTRPTCFGGRSHLHALFPESVWRHRCLWSVEERQRHYAVSLGAAERRAPQRRPGGAPSLTSAVLHTQFHACRALSSKVAVQASFGAARPQVRLSDRALACPKVVRDDAPSAACGRCALVAVPPLPPPLPPERRPLLPLLLQRLSARRVGLVVRAAQVSSNDFKTGMTIEFDGAPYKVVGASPLLLLLLLVLCLFDRHRRALAHLWSGRVGSPGAANCASCCHRTVVAAAAYRMQPLLPCCCPACTSPHF